MSEVAWYDVHWSLVRLTQRYADELKESLRQAQESMTKLREGTDEVRAILHDARFEFYLRCVAAGLTSRVVFWTIPSFVLAGHKIFSLG